MLHLRRTFICPAHRSPVPPPQTLGYTVILGQIRRSSRAMCVPFHFHRTLSIRSPVVGLFTWTFVEYAVFPVSVPTAFGVRFSFLSAFLEVPADRRISFSTTQPTCCSQSGLPKDAFLPRIARSMRGGETSTLSPFFFFFLSLDLVRLGERVSCKLEVSPLKWFPANSADGPPCPHFSFPSFRMVIEPSSS